MSDAALDEQPSAEATLAELLARVVTVEHERDEFRHERDEYKKLYLLLREENERLKRGLVGQKAEHLPRADPGSARGRHLFVGDRTAVRGEPELRSKAATAGPAYRRSVPWCCGAPPMT